MPALLLPAVGRARGQTGVAFAADHLVAVVLGREGFQAGLDDAAAQAEDEVEGRFLFGWFGLSVAAYLCFLLYNARKS